jgi:hypothetical protein
MSSLMREIALSVSDIDRNTLPGSRRGSVTGHPMSEKSWDGRQHRYHTGNTF